MAKGDSTNSQNTIDTQNKTAQNNLNNLWGQNTDRTTNFQNNYQTGVGNNLNDYNAIMQNYNQFLNPQTQTNTGTTGTTGAQPSNQTASSQPAGSGTFADKVNSLYAKYGKKDTGAGTGLTDLNYWSNDALQHASGDENYVLGRLESDLQGNGPDQSGGGSGHSNLAGGNYSNSINSALGGFQNFADTGGFTPQQIQDIRARDIAPTRAIYENAQNNVNRQRSLQNGYSPNYNATQAKLARDEAYAIGDQNTNANASIAQLVQQGKLYGNQGLASTGAGARGQDLSAISGLTNLYNATPGLANTFGNQVLGSAQQGINLGGLQNQLSLGTMTAQNQHANIPGNYQSAMGNIASALGLGGQIGGVLSKIPGLFGGGGGMYGVGGNGAAYDPNFENGVG